MSTGCNTFAGAPFRLAASPTCCETTHDAVMLDLLWSGRVGLGIGLPSLGWMRVTGRCCEESAWNRAIVRTVIVDSHLTIRLTEELVPEGNRHASSAHGRRHAFDRSVSNEGVVCCEFCCEFLTTLG